MDNGAWAMSCEGGIKRGDVENVAFGERALAWSSRRSIFIDRSGEANFDTSSTAKTTQ